MVLHSDCFGLKPFSSHAAMIRLTSAHLVSLIWETKREDVPIYEKQTDFSSISEAKLK